MIMTMNRWMIEDVSSGVETRRILGSVVKTKTGADEDCDSLGYMPQLFVILLNTVSSFFVILFLFPFIYFSNLVP